MNFKTIEKFRDNLKKGKVCLGSWQTLSDPSISELYAMSGVDWVLADMEHTVNNFETIANIIRVVDLMSCAVFVRPPSLDSAIIKRLLDFGAHGIMVPNIKTEKEANEAINSTRYKPYGNRGVGLGRAQDYGENFQDYFNWSKNGPVVLIQIEDIEGIENIENILSVDGIDAIFIGPYDLSCSLGDPGNFSSKRFKSSIFKVEENCKKFNIPFGFHIVEPNLDDLTQKIEDNYQLIAYGVDFKFLINQTKKAVNHIKNISKI